MRYQELGNLIRTERQKKGWEQADLAARLSREQQTVSRWEKGDSRPKQDDLLRLVDLFSVDKHAWSAIAGYTLDEPDTSLAPYLPLHNLSPEKFELFCRDFVKALNPEADVHRYGSQGHKQDGIDLFSKKDDIVLDYQCKRHAQFGPVDIDEAVRITTFTAQHHYLVLSRTASPLARKAMLQHSEWSLWDREDISAEIRRLPKIDAVRIVDTYFPGWRKRFLGVDDPSPWLSPSDFYLPLSNKLKLFSHGWSFVGRQTEQGLLEEFGKQNDMQAIIISGRGGIGKSRLLRAWAESVSKSSTVLFVSQGIEISPKDLELLPEGRAYLVIDDAHDRSDIKIILNGISRMRQDIKLLITTRPYGLNHLTDELTKAGIAYDPDKMLVLNDLSTDDATTLSQEILSDPEIGGNPQYAKRIAEITKDCPLATVIGSRLVAQGQIKPELLNNEKKFRDELLRSFRDVVTGEIGGSNAEFIRVLLDFIAMVQPFSPTDHYFKDAASKILQRDYGQILRDMSALEDAGVLLRRGTRLRIVPDLLADYIRADACYDERNKISTGYADKIFEEVQNDLATNLLVNISQLDWRLSAEGIQSMVMADVWKKIQDYIKNANNADRTTILKMLKDVAFYQPKELLEIVEYVKNNPATKSEDPEIARIYKYEHDHVLAELPDILQRISYNVDFLPRCADLLWELGRGDNRRLNQHPNHGIRVLQDIAKYDSYELTGKGVQINEIMLEAVKRWLRDPHVHEYRYSPLDILDQFLDKESSTDTYNKGTITFHSFGVNYENTKKIREEALQIAVSCASSGDIRVQLRAIESLSHALENPRELFGRSVSEDEKNLWEPFQLTVLGELENIAENNPHPLVLLDIKDALHWHVRYGNSPEITRRAKALYDQISRQPEVQLYHVIEKNFDRGWFLDDDERDYDEMTKKNKIFRQSVAKEFFQKYPESKKGLERLNAILTEIEKCGRNASPYFFLYELAELYPEYCKNMVEEIIQNSTTPMAKCVGRLLLGLLKEYPSEVATIAQTAIKTGDEGLQTAIADYYYSGGWVDYFSEEIDVANIKDLLSSNFPFARILTMRGVGRLGKTKPETTKQILLSTDIGTEKEFAEAYCEQFDKHYFDPDMLSQEELQHILAKLEQVDEVDDHSIEEFLEYLSKRIPIDVVKFLLKRIEISQSKDGTNSDYRPFSYTLSRHFSGVQAMPEYANVLRELREKMLGPYGYNQFWIPRLFKSLSHDFDSQSISVLSEWVDSGEEQKLEAVGMLLDEAPEDFIFQHPDFVANILQAATTHGEKCIKSIRQHVAHSVIFRGKSGTVGQPMPQDVELKEKASKMLETLQKGSISYEFYESLVKHAKYEIADSLMRSEDLLG